MGFGSPWECTEMTPFKECSQGSDGVCYTYEHHAGYATGFIKC